MTTLPFAILSSCIILASCHAFQASVVVKTPASVGGRLPKENVCRPINKNENRCKLRSTNSEYPDYVDFELDYKYYTELRVLEDDFDFMGLSGKEEEDRWKIQLTNNVLGALHYSFKNVENNANGLLEENPLVAFTIFAGAGLVTAYVLGLFILVGCMESWNPIQNGFVPYWDEEIHVMVRRIH